MKDAAHLWGKITGETEALIKSELGDPKVQILQIGPAGEQMVRYACLISMCSRAAGRTGMGAAMGSKNLKAVVVEGNRKPRLADKFFTTPLTGGLTHGKCMDREKVENAVIEYYRQRDWDPTSGRPTREALEQLELGWVADLLD